MTKTQHLVFAYFFLLFARTYLSVVEQLSLRVLVGLQINGNVLCSVLLDDALLLEALDAKNYVVCRRQQNFLSLLMSIWSVGKVTAVKYDQVLELIATTSTTGTHRDGPGVGVTGLGLGLWHRVLATHGFVSHL